MIRTVTPEEAQVLIADGQLDVVDVRGPAEYSGGHIPQARLVPLDELKANPRGVLTHDGVIFVCAKGIRSLTAAKLAEGLGYEHLYNVAGGTSAWASAGLPFVHG